MTASDRRIHGPDAAGAGSLGSAELGAPVGRCPSCHALLCTVPNPLTGRATRALAHEMPFCTYFGESSAEQVAAEMLPA